MESFLKQWVNRCRVIYVLSNAATITAANFINLEVISILPETL